MVAYIIDAILLSVAAGVIGAGYRRGYGDLGSTSSLISGSGISLVVGWLYFALMESSERGATVGKMASGCAS